VDLQTRAVQTLGEADIASYTVDCASTGLALAVGGEDGVIRLFDPDTHKLIASIESDSSPIRAVRFDNSCYHLAAIHLNGVVNLWQLHLEPDAATVIPLGPIEGHPGWAGTALAFSPDGQMLVTGGTDRTIKLWRIPDGALAQQFVTNNGPVRALAFSSDGQRIVVPGFWRTQVYDVSSGAMTALGDGGGFDAKFVGDGTAILGGTHGACRIWNFDLAASVIRSTASPVRELAAASVGTDCLLATLQLDGTLRLLKRPIQSPRVDEWQNVLSTNVGDHSRALAMSPDARWLVVGRTDGHLLTVRAADGQIVQDWPAHHKLVDVLRISPDGQTLVSGGSDGVILIARQRQDHNGWEQVALRTRPGEVDGIAISPDGNRFVTSSKMTSLDFWSVPDGTLLREISLPFTAWKLALSHDGSRLAVGMWDRSVQIWNTSWMQSDPSTVQEEMNLVGHTQLVTGQAFDSTGTLMASVSTDGTVRVWDFSGTDRTTRGDLPENRRRCLASFNAHAGDANAVTFLPSPDGMGDSLAVGFIDGTVRFWHLESLPNILNGHIRYQQQVRGIVTSASADH
jgi:WD40 repeat protein